MAKTDTENAWITDIENIEDVVFSFTNDMLIEFDESRYVKGKTYIGTVDLNRVKGCWHPDYRGCMWGELKSVPGTLKGDRSDPIVGNQILKRVIQGARELADNPEYYLNGDSKDHWSFYEYKGDFYIEAGVHRTVLGRYFLAANALPQEIRNISITPCMDMPCEREPSDVRSDKTFIDKVLSYFKTLFKE